MQLTMRVRSYCNESPVDVLQLVFDSYPISIGRSSTCDYVLHDLSKYISSNHALITQQGDELIIQDTSANGLYLNGDTEAIGRGNSVPLHHGDTITLGDYCLSVAIRRLPASTNPLDGFCCHPNTADAGTYVNQLAMLEGMKTAVELLLAQFDPDRLESRFERNNPIATNIPVNREARLWELFKQQYGSIRCDAIADFDSLFEREFRKAYEKRINAQGKNLVDHLCE